MNQLIQPAINSLKKVRNKIAFFPSLIAISGILFGFMMVYLEEWGVSAQLQKVAPWLVISDLDTARSILNTLIAGLISILVFSFSMVMIILNQAAANFSPRLLPGLISNKKHQSILGIHLAGIFYCLITLISIEPTDSGTQLPGFSVLIAILLITTSLASFIYFIHSISQSIQVDYILKSTFKKAQTRLQDLIELDQQHTIQEAHQQAFKNSDDWHEYFVPKSGYIQSINTARLVQLAKDNHTLVKVIPTKNTFLLAGVPIFRSKTKLDEDTAESMIQQFLIDDAESITENYSLAFQLITEIAIKAMSPGINDPGTALTCIDYLTELLALRMNKTDQMIWLEEDQALVSINIIPFKQLLYVILAPFRAYCSHDIIIVTKLLKMCEYLLLQDCCRPSFKNSIQTQAKEIIKDAKNKLRNGHDLKVLEQQMPLFKENP